MHEQADTVRVARLGSGGGLFQKPPEPVGIACLQECKTLFETRFETALGAFHGCFLLIT
jgi:hypothetical protein